MTAAQAATTVATVGFWVSLVRCTTVITKDRQPDALAVVKELDRDRDDLKSRLTRTDTGIQRRWAGVDADIQAVETLTEALRAFRFSPVVDPEGDLVGVALDHEPFSRGDEFHLWSVLAPFVDEGGLMEWYDEEGTLARWDFAGNDIVVRRSRNPFSPREVSAEAGPPHYAHFGVSSEEASPEAITEAIGIEPTRTVRRGERNGPAIAPRFNIWDVRTPAPDGAPMREQLEALLPIIREATPGIQKLRERYKIGVALNLYRRVEALGEARDLGIHFDEDLIHALADVGAVLDIDEYRL